MTWTEGHPMQHDLRDRPFWLLVACVLLNRAGGHQAKPVIEELMLYWPEPKHLAAAAVMGYVDEIVRPCGFQHQRASRLGRLAAMWVLEGHDLAPPATRGEVLELPGCGPYAADSYAIFVLGEQIKDPADHVLRDWVRRQNSSP